MMDAEGIQTENNISEEELADTNDLETTCNESKGEMVNILDLQYFDVQTNEIIVTTINDDVHDDGSMEITDDSEEVEIEESVENIENCQFVDGSSINAVVVESPSVESSDNKEEQKDDEGSAKGQIFILPTLDDIKELIKCYCEQTSCRFVGQIKTKDFGLSSMECDLSGHRILWQDIPHKNSADDIITFDGIPHMCVGHYQFGCEFGTDLKAARKEKLQKMKEDGKAEVKTRNVKTPSKKCGCPAKIVVRQIIKFPEFKILKNTEGRKRTGTTKLKESLKSDRKKVKTEVLYIGRLPDLSEHKYHELMEGREFSKEMVHPELVIRAQEYYLQNKSNIEIYELIRNYVHNEMFWKKDPPDSKRRRFFPKPIDIRNIVGRIRRLSRFSEEEELAIRTYFEDVKKKFEDSNIFFDVNDISMNEVLDSTGKSTIVPDSNKPKDKKDFKLHQTFIFCYQTHCQQWLVKRYNSVCYLVEIEPSDSEMKCAVPYNMYCLVVQTNVDFQVVGIIVSSKQRKFGLVQGLRCFREWNIAWDPDYFLIDYSEDIEEAITTVFPKATYFLDSQSCKKKWVKFLSTPSNNLQEHSEELLVCLESMQYALTEESLTIFASLLESNEVWKSNDNLRTWFQNSWLHSANKWVFGYRPDDLIVLQHMKISLDDSLQMYKVALGKSAKTNGFYELVQEVMENLTIQEYEKYAQRNNDLHVYHKELERKYTFPDYMQGLQVFLYPYVEVMLKLANENDFIITHDQLGLFTVQLQVGSEDQISGNNATAPENTSDENGDEQKGVVSTEFSYIEYAKKLDHGEFTVSFGDSRSYPFCTCTQWKFYKLPCVHICAVCSRLQGWRYQMFGSLYRSNPLFDIDYTCINNVYKKRESAAETTPKSGLHFDTLATNIFESFIKVGANNVVLDQANELLGQISKMTYLFKDRTLYTKIHHQLTDFVERLKTYLLTKGADEKLQIPLSTLQSRSDFVALSIMNNLKLSKPLGGLCGSIQPAKLNDVTVKTEKADGVSLPKLQPISTNKNEPCKFVLCTLDNKNSLDLVNFDIKSAQTELKKKVSETPNVITIKSQLDNDSVPVVPPTVLPLKRILPKGTTNVTNEVKKMKPSSSDSSSHVSSSEPAVTGSIIEVVNSTVSA